MAKLGRNDPCHCGSGKKYKKCCLAKDEAEEAEVRTRAAAEARAAADAPLSPPIVRRETAPDTDASESILDHFARMQPHRPRKAITLPDAPLAHPPVAADFAPDVERRQVDDALERLTLDWIGTTHQREGVALDQLGMGRAVLERYLLDRSSEDASGSTLVTPEANALEDFLWQAVGDDPAGVALLFAFLPNYLAYLSERGLIDGKITVRVLQELWPVRRMFLEYLRYETGEPMVEMAEEVDWPEPERKPPAPVPPDLAPLLERLKQMGEEADKELLERIVAYGPGAIPPLIDLATDDSLLYPVEETAATWAPIYAVRLLGQLHAQEAIEPLLPLLTIPGDNYIAMELEQALGLIGPAALPPLAERLGDRTQDEHLRAHAANTMANIAKNYAETRAEVISLIRAQIDSTTNPTLNGFLIATLMHLQALEALPSIERAFAEGRVDLFVAGDLENVRQEMLDPGSTTRKLFARMGTEEP